MDPLLATNYNAYIRYSSMFHLLPYGYNLTVDDALVAASNDDHGYSYSSRCHITSSEFVSFGDGYVPTQSSSTQCQHNHVRNDNGILHTSSKLLSYNSSSMSDDSFGYYYYHYLFMDTNTTKNYSLISSYIILSYYSYYYGK